ncbi:hypothetical protein Hanom_Chr12g01142421 [Helianthus anomalus]
MICDLYLTSLFLLYEHLYHAWYGKNAPNLVQIGKKKKWIWHKWHWSNYVILRACLSWASAEG